MWCCGGARVGRGEDLARSEAVFRVNAGGAL